MKLARVETPDGVVTGEYDDGTLIADGETYEVDSEDLLAPCEPGTFYCVGRNFAEKIDQMDYDIPEIPDWFIKPAVSLHDLHDHGGEALVQRGLQRIHVVERGVLGAGREGLDA